MSIAAAVVLEAPEHEISSLSDATRLPRRETTRVSLNGVQFEAERISGLVVGSRIKQHNRIYTTHHNNYTATGANHVYSSVQNEQWETSEVRLKLEGGTEKLFQLPFAISVGEGDLLSVISIYNPKSGKGYTAAAQNHNIGQWFSEGRNGLQKMCAQMGVFKLGTVMQNKPVLGVLAMLAFILYYNFGSLLLAVVGGFVLLGILALAFQYLVLLPYVLSVWPNINRQLRAFFEDFSSWP